MGSIYFAPILLFTISGQAQHPNPSSVCPQGALVMDPGAAADLLVDSEVALTTLPFFMVSA